MKIEYKRDLQKNYMILEAGDTEDDEGYHLRMAEQNEIQGLLSFHSGRRDGRLYLHYEITSKQSVEDLYTRCTLNYHDMLFLLNGIRDTLEGLQRYLLSPKQLLFDPQFIFMYPDKSRVFLCYFPGKNDYPINLLAEFILKRLNHEDAQAVALGYQFYQKALEENFSLQKTLKEILLSGEREVYENPGRENTELYEQMYNMRNRNELSGQREMICQPKGYQEKNNQERNYKKRNDKERSQQDRSQQEKNLREKLQQENTIPEEEEEYVVTHKVRPKRSCYKVIADKLFDTVHPLIILSALFLVVVVEIIFFLRWISLTEAGGIFFLILSVEILINKLWKSRKDKKGQKWWEEESEEEYRRLQQEMYQDHYEEQAFQDEGTEYMEVTQYLVPDSIPKGLRLVCQNNVKRENCENERYPDIFIAKEPVYVGKMKDESGIRLDSPTVSRMHARLECVNGTYYVKDMNSKNGTFVNGERLMPQEQCEIKEGDRVAFAEILYHVV